MVSLVERGTVCMYECVCVGGGAIKQHHRFSNQCFGEYFLKDCQTSLWSFYREKCVCTCMYCVCV